MPKKFATIENWFESKVYGGGTVLVGTILNHPRQNEFHTSCQQTSRVVFIDRRRQHAETENTIYTLGKELTNE